MDSLFGDIGDAFSGFAAQNLLEVAIITVVLFWVLRLLAGTTAMTVVRGIALLAVTIVVLSRVLDSVVLSWLVSNALAVLALFVLIVFQPEFRRALERLGRAGGLASFLFAPATQSYRDLVSVLTDATVAMAARKVGAIVVVERETGLQDVVDTGIAVVISHGRVVAASCMLPTAINQQAVDPHLGTRHRAALGISEQTDAVVVVVSEENGQISIAADGKLLRPLDRRRLENNLAALLHGGNGRVRRNEASLARP